MKLRLSSLLLTFAATIGLSGAANASVVLTFEGVGGNASINDFYNGGTDSAGHSGTNYGINFSPASLGLIEAGAGGGGIFANEPSKVTIAYFLTGSAATMNVAAGFDTGFSFFYTASLNSFVNVYSGLNGTGTVLATLNLGTNWHNSNCGSQDSFCHWDPVGVTFAGTAKSVDFGGVANQAGFDNITLGAAVPGGVPEPATWAMMLLGVGMVGFAMRQRFKVRTNFTFA